MRILMTLRRRLQGERDERGNAAIEITLLAPVLLVVLLFVVGLGRMAHARQQVESVAADSARAASLERNVGLSAGVAQAEARRSLGTTGVSCSGLDVSVDTSAYRPGGRISVTVSCTARMSDLAMAGFPGRHTFTATSVVPIETYRGS